MTAGAYSRSPSYREVDAAEIGRRVCDARVAAGLSQRQLAFEGCSAAYVSRLEAGQRVPSGHLLRELADRLGTTVAWLERGSRDVEVAIPEDALDGVVGWIVEGLIEEARADGPGLSPVDLAVLPAVLHLLDPDRRAQAEEVLSSPVEGLA